MNEGSLNPGSAFCLEKTTAKERGGGHEEFEPLCAGRGKDSRVDLRVKPTRCAYEIVSKGRRE